MPVRIFRVRNAGVGASRASGAARRRHPGGSEAQPSAALLPGLPRRGRLAAAGGGGEDGHRHAGHAVQLPSQVVLRPWQRIRFPRLMGCVYSPSLNCVCRDFMDPTMDSTKHILNFLMPLLEQADADLHDFMMRSVSAWTRSFH